MLYKTTPFFAAAGLYMAAAAAMPSSAVAFDANYPAPCCTIYYDHGWEDAGNRDVIGQLTERINAMELAMIEALRLGTGQLSGNMKEQIGADSNMANAQDDRAVVGRIEAARMQAMADATSPVSGCSVATLAMYGPSLSTAVSDFQQKYSDGMSKWHTGDDSMPSAQGSDVAMAARVTAHCGPYSSAADVSSGLCEVVGDMPNADINIAQSVFYREEGVLSGALSPERMQAAHLFSLNSINPIPSGRLLPSEAAGPAGREKAARLQSENARFSVADYAMADIAARVEGQKGFAGQSADVFMAKAAEIDGYNADFSNGVSWYDFMDIGANGWWGNRQWKSDMAGGPFQGALKDGVLIQSYSAYLQWETYKQNQIQNSILAHMLAILVEQNRV